LNFDHNLSKPKTDFQNSFTGKEIIYISNRGFHFTLTALLDCTLLNSNAQNYRRIVTHTGITYLFYVKRTRT